MARQISAFIDTAIGDSSQVAECAAVPSADRGTALPVTRILQIVVDRESQFEIIEDLAAAAMQHDRPGTISPNNIGDMRS